MKYFVVEGAATVPCPVDAKTAQDTVGAHVEHLKTYLDNGSILLAGPKARGGGGFTVIRADSQEDAERIFEDDPLKRAGMQEYTVTEFDGHLLAPEAAGWFSGDGRDNAVLRAIRQRRSVRAYDTRRQLEDADLELILQSGVCAPTAHNEQPWHFTVVQDTALLEDINLKANAVMARSDNDWLRERGSNPDFRATYGAPTVIFVSGREDAMSPQVDCSAAMQNMLLAAESLGIGSVWIGLLRHYMGLGEAAATLRIPKGYRLFHAAAFGYIAGSKLPMPLRKQDVFTYIRQS